MSTNTLRTYSSLGGLSLHTYSHWRNDPEEPWRVDEILYRGPVTTSSISIHLTGISMYWTFSQRLPVISLLRAAATIKC